MSKCQFDITNKSNIDDLKKYLIILLDNNLVKKEDKIVKAQFIVHPDKKVYIPNFSNDDYNCSTTIFNSYSTYLNENNIDDKSINYALNIGSTSGSETSDTTNSNFMDKLMVLSNISPELSSEQIITRVKILGEVVFGVKYDEEKSSIIDDKPLPISISQEYDEKQSNYNKIASQIESFQYYTQLLVEFEYLLCYAFILKQYSSELNQMDNDNVKQGGKKRKTIRNKNSKNKKTKRNKKGGNGELVKNIQKYSTFWSWINGKIGDLSGLDKQVVDEFEKSKRNLEFYEKSMENLYEKRIEFYKDIEKWKEAQDEERKVNEENERINRLPLYKKLFVKRPALPNLGLGESPLENNLKLLWYKQKDIYDEIDQLQGQIDLKIPNMGPVTVEMLTDEYKGYYQEAIVTPSCYSVDAETLKITMLDNPDCYLVSDHYNEKDIKAYNDYINAIIENREKGSGLENRILELQNKIRIKIEQCKKAEREIIRQSEIRTKFMLFVNYIISSKFIGKENVELFLKLCENRIKEIYISKIDIKAKTQAIIPLRIAYGEKDLFTRYKKQLSADFIRLPNFDELSFSKEEYDQEVNIQKQNLLDNLANQLSLYRTTIKQQYEDKSSQALLKLDAINLAYENNDLFNKIRKNIANMVASGTILFLNSYGSNPFSKITKSDLFPGVLSNSVYSILTTVVDNPETIVPTMDSYYFYLQIIIVIFITPNLLKAAFPTSFDNRAINSVIMVIQLIIILSFIVIYFSGFNPAESTFFQYDVVAQQETSIWSTGLYGAAGAQMSQVWNLIKNTPKFVGNNVFLCPSYYLRDMILNNGKTVIGLESWSLIGFSVYQSFTNFRSLTKEKERIFKEAEQELKQFVFSEVDLDILLVNFMERIKREINLDEYKGLLENLNGFVDQIQKRFLTTLEVVKTSALAETALATQQQTELMRQQQQGIANPEQGNPTLTNENDTKLMRHQPSISNQEQENPALTDENDTEYS